MQLIRYPEKKDWKTILERPKADHSLLFDKVNAILKEVKINGDSAVKRYTQEFDNVSIDDLKVAEEEYAVAETLVSQTLKKAISQATQNIRAFHEKQIIPEPIVET